jgi:hypothetical protein
VRVYAHDQENPNRSQREDLNEGRGPYFQILRPFGIPGLFKDSNEFSKRLLSACKSILVYPIRFLDDIMSHDVHVPHMAKM